MKEYVKFIDELPFIIRLILAFPGIDGFVYGIYRIAKGHVIAGIIWIFVGWAILWILDIFSILTAGKVTFFV